MSNGMNAGDSVQLKSGGPKMTVSEVKEWNGVMKAWCDWFDDSRKMSDSFPVTSLKVVEEAQAATAVSSRKPGAWS